MQIVIAPDSFKECLDAFSVAHAIADGVRRALPQAETILVPMSDGGEGFTSICCGKDIRTAQSSDPLGRSITASYGVARPGGVCIIEVATASGLALLERGERDPFLTSTRGTGEIIMNALEEGFREFVIGLGGSATNEGGAGIAQALGVRLLDEDGREIGGGARELARLKSIDLSEVDSRLAECKVTIATDVTNPLCGPTGASHVFARQKGARDDDLKLLDDILHNYASLLESATATRLATLPGAGAAGGTGITLHALFSQATFRRGVDIVAEIVRLPEKMAFASLVITGEGSIDGQSIYGKVPVAVASLAKKQGIPVIAIVGRMGEGYEVVLDSGIDLVLPLATGPQTLADSMRNAKGLLEQCGFRVGKLLQHCSLKKC